MVVTEVFERGATPRHRPTGPTKRHQDRHLMSPSQSRKISSSRSPASDRPRQSTLRYPALVSNRPTVHHVRRDPPPIHQPLHRRPTCRAGSIPITNLSRGSQIAIAPAARPSFPQLRFPPLEGRRPRARGPTVMGPASETLHKGGSGQASFYRFVGAGNQDWGPLDARCSRDAEIDLEVELGGTLQ
ncbi:hypothetical protein V1280_003481 [Bradyrhizobium sp. AZCC 2230]